MFTISSDPEAYRDTILTVSPCPYRCCTQQPVAAWRLRVMVPSFPCKSTTLRDSVLLVKQGEQACHLHVLMYKHSAWLIWLHVRLIKAVQYCIKLRTGVRHYANTCNLQYAMPCIGTHAVMNAVSQCQQFFAAVCSSWLDYYSVLEHAVTKNCWLPWTLCMLTQPF